MIPKLHKKGRSFQGAALYLLHDVGADTDHRVVHTETRNLATNNPEAAWRVMAATALEQPRLKTEAGIKATGRKSKDVVLHMTLSWHEDEAAGLTHRDMVAAADQAVAALKAQDRQALYVIHDDKEHPHVHVLLNRVSCEDGRILSSSKEKLALSKWAEQYEKDREPVTGRIYCEERVLNNADRERGHFTRAKKDVPRHIFELQAANENEPWAIAVREAQKQKDLEVRREILATTQRHKAEWAKLEQDDQALTKQIRQDAKRQITIAKQAAGDALRDEWAALRLAQEEERLAFAEREHSLAGKGQNILRSLRHVNWSDLLRSDRRSSVLKEGFALLAGRQSARGEVFRRQQARQTIALEKKEAEAKREAARQERSRQSRRLAEHRQAMLLQRQDLIFRHQMEGSWIATLWHERKKQRALAWQQAREQAAKIAFERSATPEEERQKAPETFMGRMRRARRERERKAAQGKTTKETLRERRQRNEERDQDRDR